MDIRDTIQELKKKHNAVILAHNYQLPEVQDLADFVGDSLGLSIQAADTRADTIVFCGVHFMAETAKILSPAKKVLLPDKDAGCPMADMITAQDLRDLKKEHPEAALLCYVNTSAEVKAECDLCCTSANAVSMVQEVLKDREEIIFVPDRYLAAYVSSKTGRTLIPWQGFCPTHARILPEDISKAREDHPDAVVMAHPECPPEVLALADCIASTEGMCRYAGESSKGAFIVATERGIIHRMEKENPGKRFYPATDAALCPNMKYTTVEKILQALTEGIYEITVPGDVADRARHSIEKMLAAQ